MAKEDVQNVVIAKNGREMGDGLLVEVLMRDHGFDRYLTNKEKWVKKLEKILENEVYIIGTLVKQLNEEKSLPVKMKLFILKALGSQKINDIQKKWIELSNQNLIKPVVDFVNKGDLLSLVHGWLMNQPFSKAVEDACYKSHTKSWTTSSPTFPMTLPVIVDQTEVSYGDAVRSWLYSSQGPSMYGLLVAGQAPDNIVKRSHVNNPVTCFLSGTKVLLSNSKLVAIEELKENDRILGRDGDVGTVSSEKVVHQLESDTAIFGFNAVEPFFTAGHPFWTQDGWRAVNPHLAKLENHWLEVGQLTEGDYVRRAKRIYHDHIAYEWVKIESIHFKDHPAGTKVYGVHTREGPRSYHANGYLVCLNYPEITSQNAVDRMSSLSSDEKKKLQKHMSELEPILDKVLGSGPAKAMKSITQKYLTEKIEKEKTALRGKIPLKDVTLHHLNLHYKAGATKLGSYSMPTKMSVARGQLFLDDNHVPDANVSNENKVSWTRKVSDDKWEHGSVKLLGSGHQGNGFIALTKSRDDTKSDLSANFLAAANVNKYKCYKSSTPSTAGNQTTTKWVDFGELEMGVDCSSGSCKTVGKILIPPMDTFDDLGHHVIFAVDSKQQLSVNVVVPTEYWSFLGYTKLSGTFSMDFASFSGTCVSYDATKSGFQGDTFAWKGVIEKNLNTEALLATARNANLNSSIHALKQPEALLGQSVDAVDGSSEEDAASEAAPMALTMASLTDQSLSVDELYMITPPDPQSVHELTFSLLQQGMKYEMDDSLREEILGVVRPDLSGDMTSVADTYKDFLGKRFANAYLMNGLANSAHYKDKITEEQRNQLLYYWAGNGSGCLAQDADYNKANNDVSRIAYIQSCPVVDKYVKATEGGSYWAKQLYDKLNETEVLNGLALTAEVSETMSVIQKQSMVLFCLSPKEDYGAKFYRTIMMTRLKEMTNYFNGNADDDEVMKEIFTDSIHQLILKILTGGDETTKEVTQNLVTQLNDAAKEFNVDMTKTNEEIANELMGHFENFVSDVITLYNARSGTSWDKLVASVKQWQDDNPIKAGIAKFFSVAICSALWIAGIYFTIKTFMDWKDLKPEQKVSLIADCADITIRSIAGIPDLIENFQTSCKNGKIAFNFIKNKIAAGSEPEAVQEIEMVTIRNVEVVEGELDFYSYLSTVCVNLIDFIF